MPKIWVPAGKIPTKSRPFHSVAADVRHTVFSVHRLRPLATGGFGTTSLGSGFFVTSQVFITCWHVIDGPAAPHQPGDLYRLVNNLDGQHGIIHEINGRVGNDIHLFPDHDLAILISKSKLDQAYLPVSYADVPVGAEIGVAGYPLAQLSIDANANITIGGVVYRVARNAVTAVYRTDLNAGDGHPLQGVTVLEVNFLFVPGNSGGPIFEADTGRAVAYVKGFRHHKIAELEEHCNLIPVPAGIQPNYLDSIRAVYSIGLTLDRVRTPLEQFGVKL
ncbi:MAG: serine protease [Candidatus Acidiferrales bacterium]